MGRCSASAEQRPDRSNRQLRLRDEAARRALGNQRAEIAEMETRGEDHLHRQVKRGELLGNVEAVGVGQLHVNEDEIWFMFAGKLNATRPRYRLSNDREALGVEHFAQSAAEGGVVVDDENPSAHEQILPATIY
jgi:hypothetical protein